MWKTIIFISILLRKNYIYLLLYFSDILIFTIQFWIHKIFKYYLIYMVLTQIEFLSELKKYTTTTESNLVSYLYIAFFFFFSVKNHLFLGGFVDELRILDGLQLIFIKDKIKLRTGEMNYNVEKSNSHILDREFR